MPRVLRPPRRAPGTHPDFSQILTCGSNAKIAHWEAASGNAIRVVHAGDAKMTALDMSKKRRLPCQRFRRVAPLAHTLRRVLTGAQRGAAEVRFRFQGAGGFAPAPA